jgi:hypothetical protein
MRFLSIATCFRFYELPLACARGKQAIESLQGFSPTLENRQIQRALAQAASEVFLFG